MYLPRRFASVLVVLASAAFVLFGVVELFRAVSKLVSFWTR